MGLSTRMQVTGSLLKLRLVCFVTHRITMLCGARLLKHCHRLCVENSDRVRAEPVLGMSMHDHYVGEPTAALVDGVQRLVDLVEREALMLEYPKI